MTGAEHSPYLPDFEVFVRERQAWVVWEAFRLCSNWHQAEDLAQTTLSKVFRHWYTLSDHGQLAGYTYQTLVRTYISERRRLHWRSEILQAEMPERANVDSSSIEDHTILMSAMNKLGERQRTVILLRFWFDLDVAQTSIVMRCSPGTVTSQTNRALKRLRVLLVEQRRITDAPAPLSSPP